MSGRLIILPKKSWHVWNADNRERVLRDERLHREAQEQQAEKQMAVDRDNRLDLLRARKRRREDGQDEGGEEEGPGDEVEQKEATAAAAAAGQPSPPPEAGGRDPPKGDRKGLGYGKKRKGSREEEWERAKAHAAVREMDRKGSIIPPDKKGYVEGQQHEGHVHLFGQVQEQLAKHTGHKDHAREKAAKDLAEKRKQGIAPWGFDDVKAPKQWYEQPTTTTSSSSTASASVLTGRGGELLNEERTRRALQRKEKERVRADPAAAFMSDGGKGTVARPSRFSSSSSFPPRRLSSLPPPPPGGDEDDGSISSSSSSSSSSSEEDEGRHRKRFSSSHKKKKVSKHKKKKKKKKKAKKKKERRRSPSPSPPTRRAAAAASTSSSSAASMDALRQRRLERERQEHRKTVNLLAARQRAGLSYPTAASPLLDQGPVEMDDRKRDYNSRFYQGRR